jgi:hypothetical protein
MTVVCADCEREGRPAVLWERAPLEDRSDTHGYCGEHLARVHAEIRVRFGRAALPS